MYRGINDIRYSVRTALRAAAWKATPGTPPASFAGLVAWICASVAVDLAIRYVEAGEVTRFNIYGLNATVAYMAVLLTLSAFVLPREGRMTALSVMMAMSIVSNLVWLAVVLAVPVSFWERGKDALLTTRDIQIAWFLAHLTWWCGAMLAALRSVDASPYGGRVLRLIALYAATLAAFAIVPHYPVFYTRDFDLRTANLWEQARTMLRGETPSAPPPRRVDRAHVELAQPALMDEAIARLAPQTHGETDVYAIGIAGWAEQDVFIKELDGALAAVGKVLPVRDRTLRLVNHVDTVKETPVALRANFAAAVRAVARKMDRDEDVLLLFMTSHGSPDGVALQLPGLFSADLAPEDVADVLDREGIKNRIVVVSACYSGVFVKPLANDNTIVLTAADEKSTSFGCSNEREWTYFGDAFFNHNLRADVSIEEAFLDAKVTIGQWEARDGLTSSNPQGHFGPALMKRLARVYGGARTADRARSATP